MTICAIITDQHIGARNDNVAILRNQEKFYQNVFFPALKKYKVEKVIDGGDTFDRRKTIDYRTWKSAKQFYFDPLHELGIQIIAILGNHSVYYKDSNDVNSLDLVLKEYPNFKVIQELPEEITIGSKTFLFAPWINQNNHDESMEIISKSRASILVAHLEIEGFQMQMGTFCKHGMDRKAFHHFDRVWTGHFHSPSIQDNIHYLGSPTETTWADHGDPKGFYIYDTETDELTFIENPYSLHQVLSYEDELVDLPDIEGKYVVVNVMSKDNPKTYAKFMEAVFEGKPFDVKVSERYIVAPKSSGSANFKAGATTEDIINRYVEGLDHPRKTEIGEVLLDAYKLAMESE